MKKHYLSQLLLVTVFITFLSCSDNNDYLTVDDLPVASDDTVSSTLTGPVSIDVLANDTTGDFIVASTVSIVGGTDTDANGSLDELVVANQGTWSVNPLTGAITFTPLDTFTGNPTPISYTVKDAENNSSNAAIVTINAEAIVTADLSQVPFTKLSDYHFFMGDIKNQIPSLNVIPYEPASALFSDYAHKKRFVWMPKDTHATYNGDDNIFDFPVGAILIKTFYYDNVQPSGTRKNIETRLLVRKADGWKLYDYVWNEAQTDATLETTGNGLSVPVNWIDDNGVNKSVNFRIPSETECVTCHKINPTHAAGGEITIPIGPKPQNLNTIFNYVNGGAQNQIEKWQSVGYLGSDVPALSAINSTVDWRDTSKSLSLRARSYIDMNCAHCHRDGGHCDYTPQRFNFSNTDMHTFGVCLAPLFNIPDHPYIINAGNADHSELIYRISTNDQAEMMPIIGRTVVHEEGVQLIKDWINTLTQHCN